MKSRHPRSIRESLQPWSRAALLALLFSCTLAQARPGGHTPDPAGFDKFLVYMSNSRFNFFEPHPIVPGCDTFPGICATTYFHEVIMKRSPEEIADRQQQAADFFAERFGIDVFDPSNQGRILFSPFYLDPRRDYRAFVVSGAPAVPRRGWTVRDGGFIALVTDPEGFELGGEFAGMVIPEGAFVIKGTYNIAKRNRGKRRRQIIIEYRASSPVIRFADGTFKFRCELEHPRWGTGLAQGVFNDELFADGVYLSNVRNVLTFPGLGPAE